MEKILKLSAEWGKRSRSGSFCGQIVVDERHWFEGLVMVRYKNHTEEQFVFGFFLPNGRIELFKFAKSNLVLPQLHTILYLEDKKYAGAFGKGDKKTGAVLIEFETLQSSEMEIKALKTKIEEYKLQFEAVERKIEFYYTVYDRRLSIVNELEAESFKKLSLEAKWKIDKGSDTWAGEAYFNNNKWFQGTLKPPSCSESIGDRFVFGAFVPQKTLDIYKLGLNDNVPALILKCKFKEGITYEGEIYCGEKNVGTVVIKAIATMTDDISGIQARTHNLEDKMTRQNTKFFNSIYLKS